MSQNQMTDCANAATTAAYFQKHNLPDVMVRALDGVSVSALAVGTYLGNPDEATDRLYENALVQAAQKGVNFFDTAINYRCQRSERNIAYAIRKLSGLGVPREALFISTKGGFLPAEGSLEGFREYISKCYLNTGIIKPEDIVANCHCMTPEYIQSQINLSLANLKIKTIDLYYLHNTEIQMPVVGKQQYYQKLTAAFEMLERNVAEGKIARYGLATWDGLRRSFGAEDLIDLETVIGCARAVAGDQHHFRAIQLPYNLAMLEAVGMQNQKIASEDYPIIPTAAHHGIAVLASAPLMQSHLLKMPPDLVSAMPGSGTAAQKALQFVISSPGVIAAMVGMKSSEHVDENLGLLQQPLWTVPELQNVARLLVRG